MIIYLARNNEKNIEYEHWKNIEAAFESCEREFEAPDTPYSVAWVQNDFANYEMWIIRDKTDFIAQITPFEVVRIEVFD